MREPSQTLEKELRESCPTTFGVAGLRGAGIFLATSFAFLAEQISNSMHRESGIPEHAATVCVAPDGAEGGWAVFVLLRVFRMLPEDG